MTPEQIMAEVKKRTQKYLDPETGMFDFAKVAPLFEDFDVVTVCVREEDRSMGELAQIFLGNGVKDKNGKPSQETIPMLATMAPLLTMDEVERAFVITQVLGGMKHILKNYQELLHTLEQVVKENREMKKIMQAGVDPAERTKGLLS